MQEETELRQGPTNDGLQEKQVVRDSYGCINWQPTIGNLEDLVQMKGQMKNFIFSDNSYDSQPPMKATYPLQRMEINNGKAMKDLLEEWPFLFCETGLLFHFEELTGISLKEKLTEAFHQKASRILTYAKLGIKNQKLAREACNILGDMTFTSDNNDRPGRPSLLAVLRLLMLLLGEKDEQLFYVVDEHTHHSEVSLNEKPPSPFLIACGDSLLSAQRFMLVVDRIIIMNNITSVVVALAVLFAAYYCFNLQYPEGASATLEFIQRCFVGINPDSGTKACRSKKKALAMNGKVMSLISSLADFEWINVL